MASHGVARGPRTRTDEQKRLDAEKIRKYRQLEDELRTSDLGENAFQLTTRLLRLNPEYYTVWNVRRRCLISTLGEETVDANAEPNADKDTDKDTDIVQTLAAELQFTVPLLIEFPKCYWIWSYRLWILQQAVQRLDAATWRRIWLDELALDSKMLTRDRRNFHAWGYRRQLVEQLERSPADPDQADQADQAASLVEPEFAYTTKMVHMDLSNFSAWHNRSKLIPRLLAERQADDEARTRFLDEELGMVREALNVGPEDQSLWFYHQFLMLNLTDHFTGHPAITPHFSLEERTTYVLREIDAIKDLLLDYDDIKWIYEALIEYSVSLARMEARPLALDERTDVSAWLVRLRDLDPMRRGRWDDLEAEHVLGRRTVASTGE